MLNFSSAAQCWELVGNPLIHDQMFGVGALGSSREPRGLFCRGLQGRWQQPGAGELGPGEARGHPGEQSR